ncbi:MAG: hypothetical protein JXQ69_06435 [Paludibacteraceae bacterium]|nr:hypothetical protein [Paludibacteraceae bacterium]
MKYLLLVLFLGYYSSITLFQHVHLVEGHYIVHSHFYKSESQNTPVKKHSHPISVLFIIQQLNQINAEEGFLFSPYQQPIFELQSILRPVLDVRACYSTQIYSSSRAPPLAS